MALLTRRTFTTALVSLAACKPRTPPQKFDAPWIQSGDVSTSAAIVWARAPTPGKLVVDWSLDPQFAKTTTIEGPMLDASTDRTGQLDLTGLPAGADVFYRAHIVAAGGEIPAAAGRFRTVPTTSKKRRIVWTADCAGQGWGVDASRGGMRGFESMRALDPDLLLHLGDRIYADGVIPPRIVLPDGSTWNNVTTTAKSKVAETLDDYRGNYAYNFLDENVRRFHSEVPFFALWDDHEVRNNWWTAQILEDPRYSEKSVAKLAERAFRAMVEYTPIRPVGGGSIPRYRVVSAGPDVDVFLLDGRSFRGSNDRSTQPERLAFFGDAQIAWLARAVADSKATWKIIASDMPLGVGIADLLKPDGTIDTFDGVANGRPEAGGRELEIADLLASFQRARVKNVVWICADVHYTAAHEYHPKRARVTAFDPFWEFVAGPIHAGSFFSARLDETFGPELAFQTNNDAAFHQGSGPATEHQYFGVIDVAEGGRAITVSLRNTSGKELFAKTLEADA